MDEQQKTLQFWWMLELFSPQKIPKPTSRVLKTADRHVMEWRPSFSLPWETLDPPAKLGNTERVWQHTVYLGVYNVESIYASLHKVFGEDKDAYDERPDGRSACAGIVVDHEGKLVEGSAVLSSALWAARMIETHGMPNSSWAHKFHTAQKALLEEIDIFEGARVDEAGAHMPLAQDEQSVLHVLRIAQEIADVTGVSGHATNKIVIQSVAVAARRDQDAGDTDFLNSFFLDDLAEVQAYGLDGHEYGEALSSYLTSDQAIDHTSRLDVIQNDESVNDAVSLENLPKGRWPSNPEHALSLRQQFAVNYALNTLAPTRGLMGVNGPPGTGKTTMLRDIFAGNIVERARQLGKLAHPEDAFTSVTYRWKAGNGYGRSVKQLRPELTGYEMVVVSANNAAVENVTAEVPARSAIDKLWHNKADYFADIATEVLAAVDGQDNKKQKIDAWGLVAARLGNKRNRSAFHSAFWFDKKQDSHSNTNESIAVPRMQTLLTQWRDGTVAHKSWAEACNDFAEAEKQVDKLVMLRRNAQDRLEEFSLAREAVREWTEHGARLQSELNDIDQQRAAHQPLAEQARRDSTFAEDARERHLSVKPGIVETIFTCGRVIRDWRAELRPLQDRLRAAKTRQHLVDEEMRQLESQKVTLQQNRLTIKDKLTQAIDSLKFLQRQCTYDKEKIGCSYPDETWIGTARELRAPWLDAELDSARSELFLAALQLHQAFLANTAAEMSKGLRAALEVVSGNVPHNLEPEKRRAAWQLFFLVVPVVSTTFASFGRMFGNIGPESIGWVLIDEAGQASPQYAAGAIWRAQRVVAVGDPLQLQPVVTIPSKMQRDIASAYRVSDTWIPPQASVQTLADRVSLHGTTFQQGETRVWVSTPLTVHRRCSEPMFTLCNSVAYNGIMVNGLEGINNDADMFNNEVEGKRRAPIAVSHWVDEPALTSGSHLQENQIERFEKALRYLTQNGVAHHKVIAISPFRAVADRLSSLSQKYPGLTAGTIHTAQGREAEIVFLVLGGDPASPGAKAWAASTVNLVNVAVSRAKSRLYVIGDRDSWAKHNYFQQLSESLKSHLEQ